ncbi:MAG: HEAT repeat domain-containing protein [Planctomycetota bacterium]
MSGQDRDAVYWCDQGDGGLALMVGSVRIELRADLQPEDFTSEVRNNIVDEISKVIGKRPPMESQHREGSVRLGFDWKPEDAEKLLWAVKAGELEHVGVFAAEMSGSATEEDSSSGSSTPELLTYIDSNFDQLESAINESVFAHNHDLGSLLNVSLKTLEEVLGENSDEALATLISLGHESTYTIPYFYNALNNEDDSVRYRAARALGQLGVMDGADVIQELIEAMGDSSPDVRVGVLLSLGKLGQKGWGAIPNLIQATEDSVDIVRKSAFDVISQFAASSAAVTAVTAIIREVHMNEFGDVMRAAIRAAVAIDAHHDVDELSEIISDGLTNLNLVFRKVFVEVVGEMGEDAEHHAEMIAYSLKSKDSSLRQSAVTVSAIFGCA